MKKILIVLVLITAAFIGCRTHLDQEPKPVCPTCKDYTNESFDGLSVTAAAQLSNLYAAHHYPNYTINGNADDARAIWFSLDKMKKFIAKIEEAMCKCDSARDLGIRIYFGEYPDAPGMQSSASFNMLDVNMAQRHTLFMVPTYNYNNVDYDFDPWHLGRGGCNKPTTICEWFGTDSSYINNNMLALAPDESTGNQNHGNMCPPLCPEGSSCFPTVVPSGLSTQKPGVGKK